MAYPKLIIQRNRVSSIKRKHPWIFSGAIKNFKEACDSLNDGDFVEIVDEKFNFLAVAYFSNGTIAARILSFLKVEIDSIFWENILQKAFNLRKNLGLVNSEQTNAYRLIHGEGDYLSGLIIDIYKENAVIQAHTVGIANNLELISNALVKLNISKTVYSKSQATLHKNQNFKESIDRYFKGNLKVPQYIIEGGLKFEVDWVNGQKTGFFLDQRENRELLKRYSKGKKVLNTFCYSGGFSIYALSGKAKVVHSVDSSQRAIDHCLRNIKLNEFDIENNKCFQQDTLKYLKECDETYDLIILDPPAYAKNIKAKHRATQAYKRLNIIALEKLNKKGLLFTFSCSQAINRTLFEDTIRAAAIEVGRNVRILHHLSQGPDHPVNIYHPEGQYLKGLVLAVD